MTPATEYLPLQSAVADLLRGNASRRERGSVEAGGETVRYEVRSLDARTEGQRARDEDRGRPDGNIIVVIPGHGQTIDGPKKLLATSALLSRSKIAWCIDPVPARGGDRTEAVAIAAIARQRASAMFPATEGQAATGELPVAATVIGWSHGGSEALRAVGQDPILFPQFLGLCPTGLVDRHPLELLASFFLEALSTSWASARRRDWMSLKDTLRVGLNAAVGLARDLWQSRSPRRLVEDIAWAGRKVPGEAFGYTGEVVLVWGKQDRVIRWRDAFPGCESAGEIAASVPGFRQGNFPDAGRVEVRVIEGDHVAPETNAPSFVRLGLGLLDQLEQLA